MKENLFLNKTIGQIHEDFKNKNLDPITVAQTTIDKFDKIEDKYKAWVCFDKEHLLKKAENIKECIARKKNIRLLEGIPVGIKDIFNTIDFPTQMGSPIWKNFTPGNDARVVYYIKQAGGIIPGKTVTAEFAVHTLDKTLNPHDITRTPGTSSSGSAVAVALGMIPVALGTQTAGSIVRPASFCGIYGCKPSFGTIPRTGMLKTTDSLDTVGFFTSKFEDLERVFDIIRVHGPDYPMSYNAFSDKIRQNKSHNHPWRVALVKTHTWNYAYDYAKNALINFGKKLAKINEIEINEIELPEDMKLCHDIHATIYNKALSYYFKEEYKKAELVSPIMNELIIRGNEISISEYHNALRIQERLAHMMDNFFQNIDILISLSTAGEAPLREETERPDPALMWTMTHLPVISAPVFLSPSGLPFGVQFAGRRYNDPLLFKFLNYLKMLELIPNGVKLIEKEK